MSDNLFMGKNDMPFWFGIVTDNGDPMGLGRCRVRVYGWHNQNSEEIPDDALPWAFMLSPTTNASIAGVGSSIIGPQKNTRVFGTFLDGHTAQLPFILGCVSGETVRANIQKTQAGSTPSQPNYDPLVGNTPVAREGDCPPGYEIESTTINTKVPDPRNVKINRNEWVIPFTGFVSSPYGARGGSYHCGVDICPAGYFKQHSPGAPVTRGRLRGVTGLPVVAAASGVVKYIWRADIGQRGQPTTYDKDGRGSRSFGNAIAIEHNLSTGSFITIYAHLGTNQDAALDAPLAGVNVTVGQTVEKGQQIGTVGRTHVRDSLTHLHFEIRVGNALPKSNNHIHPGIVFPQLIGLHEQQLAWVNQQTNYNIPAKWNTDDAPCIYNQPPRD